MSFRKITKQKHFTETVIVLGKLDYNIFSNVIRNFLN